MGSSCGLWTRGSGLGPAVQYRLICVSGGPRSVPALLVLVSAVAAFAQRAAALGHRAQPSVDTFTGISRSAASVSRLYGGYGGGWGDYRELTEPVIRLSELSKRPSTSTTPASQLRCHSGTETSVQMPVPGGHHHGARVFSADEVSAFARISKRVASCGQTMRGGVAPGITGVKSSGRFSQPQSSSICR